MGHNSSKITIFGTKLKQNPNILGAQLKQNHDIWIQTKAKSQYLEHNSHKITIFGTHLKQNSNIGNTTQAK